MTLLISSAWSLYHIPRVSLFSQQRQSPLALLFYGNKVAHSFISFCIISCFSRQHLLFHWYYEDDPVQLVKLYILPFHDTCILGLSICHRIIGSKAIYFTWMFIIIFLVIAPRRGKGYDETGLRTSCWDFVVVLFRENWETNSEINKSSHLTWKRKGILRCTYTSKRMKSLSKTALMGTNDGENS